MQILTNRSKTDSLRYEEPKSRFGLYTGVFCALAAGWFFASAANGKSHTEKNLGMLCSAHGGLEFAGETKTTVLFTTTFTQQTVQDVLFKIETGKSPSYIREVTEYDDAFEPGKLAFTKGATSLKDGVFKIEPSVFALTKAVPMHEAFRTYKNCIENVNAKMAMARAVDKAKELEKKIAQRSQHR